MYNRKEKPAPDFYDFSTFFGPDYCDFSILFGPDFHDFSSILTYSISRQPKQANPSSCFFINARFLMLFYSYNAVYRKQKFYILSERKDPGSRVWLKQKNTQIYKVNLYAEAEEYSYEIDASTGEILEKEYDYKEEYSSTVSVPSGVISRSEAIALVLARVEGSTDWDIRIKLDKGDG